MEIISQKILNDSQKKRIIELWNNEYPEKLAYSQLEDFDNYLNSLSNVEHYLLNNENVINGWGITFNRENLIWFAIIVDSKNQGKGFGSLFLNKLKDSQDELNGWVIDHDNDSKLDGSKYKSPLAFYKKNDFEILNDFRIDNEKISAVRIQWKKK